MPDEIKRFGKELDDYRSDLFRKEYLPGAVAIYRDPADFLAHYDEARTHASPPQTTFSARDPRQSRIK